MRRLVASLLAAGLCSLPANATMKAGDLAPDFALQAALDGKEFTFSLAASLKKGPVVVYFYPKAFTRGCSIEAHDFAQAIAQFHALGASVIGVSHDDIGTLDKFSVAVCQRKFPVAADVDGNVMRAWNTVLAPGYANRTSYVIAPDGHILYAFTDMNPDHHVENTLKALKAWKAGAAAK
jgi:thioredoxin-dependent peroxiredoxin